MVLVITEALLSVQSKSLKQQKDPQYLQKDIWCNRSEIILWVTDGSYNTMFLVTDKGVVAVDAPPTIGKNYLKAIAEVTNKPVTYVIYSHAHLDHIGAAGMFPRNATFIANKKPQQSYKEQEVWPKMLLLCRQFPQLPLPRITHCRLEIRL